MLTRIEYLADHPEAAPVLARWHHREWGHMLPDWSLERRSLNCLALKLAAEQRNQVLEAGLVRRARETYQIVQQDPDPKERVFRTVSRKGTEPAVFTGW